MLLILTGAPVGPEAQHVVHAGHGLHPAGCHFGRRRPHDGYPTSRDNPSPSGISQEVKETASQSQGSNQVFLIFNVDRMFLCTLWLTGPSLLYLLYFSYLYEPEGNACSLTDSTAEEHVLALVEHSADEARDRINRYMPSSKVLN